MRLPRWEERKDQELAEREALLPFMSLPEVGHGPAWMMRHLPRGCFLPLDSHPAPSLSDLPHPDYALPLRALSLKLARAFMK